MTDASRRARGRRAGADRVAFVRVGPVPLASGFVLEQLRQRFPEYRVEVVDIKAFVRSRRDVFAVNAALTLARYGLDVARGRKDLRESFLRTGYLFGHVKRMMRARVRPETHAFTFQIQSLFDASVEGVPNFVYTDHTNLTNLEYGTREDSSLYPARWRRLEGSIYRNAEHVFVRSAHVARTLVEGYGVDEGRVHCVYAGSNARVAPDGADPARYAAKRILWVGMDWKRKGGPDLLAAFRRLRAAHPDASLTLVGDAPPLAEPGIEVVGRVGIDAIHRHYGRASVFCMPTQREPFGIVFVEAMAHGLPVVATRIGALPDMVRDGHNGSLVEPGDVDALTARLDALLADPAACRSQGENGLRVARERYNWDSVGRLMEGHIREALGSSGTPTATAPATPPGPLSD